MKRTSRTLSLAAALALSLALASPLALADRAAPPPEAEAMHDFVSHYYLAPDSARAAELIPILEDLLAQHPSAASPMIGLYAGIVTTSPERAAEWRALLDDSPAPWLKAAIELGFADPEERAKALAPATEEMGASTLDFLWGWFFATGDTNAAHHVIHRGGIVYPEYASLDLTQATASWSAKAIAREHPAVAAQLDAYVLSASDRELRVFFLDDPECVAPVRDILSPVALARLDALFAPPPGPFKTNVPRNTPNAPPEAP